MANFDFQQTAEELQEFVNTVPEEIEQLRALYEALTQSEIVPVASADWPVSDPQEKVIYRVAGTSSYTDYMWNGTDFIPMATYDNVPVPTDIPAVGSTDFITAGGVANHGSAFDISEYNKTGTTLATYEDLDAALAAVPSTVQKGGMSVKFVKTSDNKYVQFRLMSTAWSTNVSNWQSMNVDDEPTTGSDNLVKSGGVAESLNKKASANSLNLYNEAQKEIGILMYATGALNVYNTSFRTSPFIGITGNTYYYIKYATRANNNVICWYDTNKQYISGTETASISFVVNSPQNAAYLRISMYCAANGTMVAEGDAAIDYVPYGEKYVLSENVYLNNEQIAAAQGNIPEEIVEIKKDLSEVVSPENTYKRLARIGNAAQHYNGDIGDNIADCIVSGGGRYSTPIVEGKTYVICRLTLDPILITNSSGVVIAKYTASPIVTGQNNYMLRFTAPQGSTTAYISGVYDTARAPIIYTLENDNNIVINKGYKKACTASDDTLLSVTNKIIFGEKAKALHCAGTGSITLSMDSAYMSAGLWLNIPYQYFNSERLSSVTVEFKNNDTTISTRIISKNSENKEYFNVKDWAFLFMQNIDSNTNTANKVVISWVLENENDSIDIFLYPYIIVDFLFFPTVIFNLEHWDATSGMNRGILSHGLKLVVSGNLPSSDEDIQYAKDCVASGLLEYGFYARENGGDPATVPSLEEETDMKDMPTYIYDRIQAKINVTKEQHFYGGGRHTIPAKSAIVGKIHGIDEYRFYNGQGMSIVTNEDSCIMIPTNYLLFFNYYVPNNQGVFSYFDHSGASGNQYGDSTFGVSFTKLKALCDAGFCLNMTPKELKNYKKEFVITEYKELL